LLFVQWRAIPSNCFISSSYKRADCGSNIVYIKIRTAKKCILSTCYAVTLLDTDTSFFFFMWSHSLFFPCFCRPFRRMPCIHIFLVIRW
jgi:hypothetical protein